jgi:hypothetical protein
VLILPDCHSRQYSYNFWHFLKGKRIIMGTHSEQGPFNYPDANDGSDPKDVIPPEEIPIIEVWLEHVEQDYKPEISPRDNVADVREAANLDEEAERNWREQEALGELLLRRGLYDEANENN